MALYLGNQKIAGGGGSGSGNANIVSCDNYADYQEKLAANIAAGKLSVSYYTPDDDTSISPTVLSDYAALSGENSISGSNDISVLNITQSIYAAHNLPADNDWRNTTLIVQSGSTSYNVTFADFARAVSSFNYEPQPEPDTITVNFYDGVSETLLASYEMHAGEMIPNMPNKPSLLFAKYTADMSVTTKNYTFKKWTDKDGNEINASTIFTKSTNVYARWGLDLDLKPSDTAQQGWDNCVKYGIRCADNTQRLYFYPGTWYLLLRGPFVHAAGVGNYYGGVVEWKQRIIDERIVTRFQAPCVLGGSYVSTGEKSTYLLDTFKPRGRSPKVNAWDDIDPQTGTYNKATDDEIFKIEERMSTSYWAPGMGRFKLVSTYDDSSKTLGLTDIHLVGDDKLTI